MQDPILTVYKVKGNTALFSHLARTFSSYHRSN